MLELLQDRASVGGRELSERLEVDPRTVRRYATRLAELGIPVEAERGRGGGYRLRPGYKLPPLMLTDEEATAIVLGLVAAQQFGLATAAPAVDGALAKLRRVLPTTLRERALALEETLGFTYTKRDRPAPATEHVLTLAEAIRRRRRVRLHYTNTSGERSQREVDPYGLVFHAGRWYLAAQDHLRGALRTFRVDRIESARQLRAAAPPPQGFDAVDHVTRSLARAPWGFEVEVLLEQTTLEAVRRRFPPTFAELEERGEGEVLLHAQADSLDWMARQLASIGCPFIVLRPPELRSEVRALAGLLTDAAAREPETAT